MSSSKFVFHKDSFSLCGACMGTEQAHFKGCNWVTMLAEVVLSSYIKSELYACFVFVLGFNVIMAISTSLRLSH